MSCLPQHQIDTVTESQSLRITLSIKEIVDSLFQDKLQDL